MLQVQTHKPARTFNHHANIRTDKPTPNSMMTRVRKAGFQALLTDASGTVRGKRGKRGRTGGEYQENTKRIRRHHASTSQATGLHMACNTLETGSAHRGIQGGPKPSPRGCLKNPGCQSFSSPPSQSESRAAGESITRTTTRTRTRAGPVSQVGGVIACRKTESATAIPNAAPLSRASRAAGA
jgi:hypothetical protein